MVGTDQKIFFNPSQLLWGQITKFYLLSPNSDEGRSAIFVFVPSSPWWGQISKFSLLPTNHAGAWSGDLLPPNYRRGRLVNFFAPSQPWWGQISKFPLLPPNHGRGRSANFLCPSETSWGQINNFLCLFPNMVRADQQIFFAPFQSWWGQISNFSLLPPNHGRSRSENVFHKNVLAFYNNENVIYAKANWKLIERFCLSPTYIRLTKIISKELLVLAIISVFLQKNLQW